MIDLVKKFSGLEPKITNHLVDKVGIYFKSKQYKTLCNRIQTLGDSNNMRFGNLTGRMSKGQASYISNVGFPLVLEARRLREAGINANYRNDPLVTLDPIGDTTLENAINMQDVLNMNFKATYFRDRTFRKINKSVAMFGSSVVFTNFRMTERPIRKTMINPETGEVERMEEIEQKYNSKNTMIDLKNYFQNPAIARHYDSDYNGHIQQWTINDLIDKYKNQKENYIEENLKKVIEKAKKNQVENKDYSPENEESDDRKTITVTHFFGTVNISDNEDDSTIYYAEIADGKIIRFQENPYDLDVVPYTVFGLEHRADCWWSNCDSELVMPHENFMNIMGNLMLDNSMRASVNHLFVRNNGKMDFADMNNRYKSGGFIPVNLDRNERLTDMLMPYQHVDRAGANYDQSIREVKESAQKLSSKPDFLRTGTNSGLQNNTATAAQLMNQESNILEANLMESVGVGYKELGEKNGILLQQFMPQYFKVKTDVKEQERELEKKEIIGSFAYEAKSSLQKNTQMEVMNLLNQMTQLHNLRNSGMQEMAALNMQKVVKETIRKMDFPGDIDEIFPDQAQLPQGQPQQALPQEQAMQQGMV